MNGREKATRRRVWTCLPPFFSGRRYLLDLKGSEPRHSWYVFHLLAHARATLFFLLFASVGTLHAAPQVYTFGVTPQYDQRQLTKIWQPILDELTYRTGLLLSLAGVPQVADFEKRFVAGQYDFVYISPYFASMAVHQHGYRLLVRDRAEDLYGVLVVRRDSPIQTPRDLNGKVVAFPLPNALSASLLIRADLANQFHVQITPRYVQTHSSVYLQVAQGLVDAGGGVQGTFDSQAKNLRDHLRIIHTTIRLPSLPVVAHPRVPLAVSNKIRQALLDMGDSATGRALLAAVPIKRVGVASAQDYAVIGEIGLKAFYVGDGVP